MRAQTAVVIAFATLVEYTCSPLLHVYVYRLHNVPAFVPPGHGLVYLAAYTIGRSRLVRRYARQAVTATVVLGGLYALWGLSPLAPRLDVLGAFWFCCLLGFLQWGRSRLLYVGAFLVVTYLELIGTGLGTWAWTGARPDRARRDGQPAVGCCRRLRVVRPRCGHRGTVRCCGGFRAPCRPLTCRWIGEDGVVGAGRSWRRPRRRRALTRRWCSSPARPPRGRPATSAATSQIESSGSAATSTAPSATRRCDQKSP